MLSNNYVIIQGWMCNELELKGNELLVFALIYGFSQDGESVFSGSRSYIADTFNISKPTVDKALSELISKNLIEKKTAVRNNAAINIYRVSKEVVKKLYTPSKETLPPPSKETLPPPSKETLPNKNNKEKINNKNIENNGNFLGSISKSKKRSLYSQCMAMVDSFTDDGKLRSVLKNYLDFRIHIPDKPLYATMWKGMLNKLQDLYEAGDEYLEIVNQSIEKGYLSFYPVNKRNGKKFDAANSNTMTDMDYENLKNDIRERKRNGKIVSF